MLIENIFSSSFWARTRRSSEGEGTRCGKAVLHEQQHHGQPAARAHRRRSPPPPRPASHRPSLPGNFPPKHQPCSSFSVSLYHWLTCSQQRTHQHQVTDLRPKSMGHLRPATARRIADRWELSIDLPRFVKIDCLFLLREKVKRLRATYLKLRI